MKFNFLLALFSYHTKILTEKYLYSKELESIKKSNRFRTRELFDDNLVDLASNDYLGLSTNKTLFQNAYENILKEKLTMGIDLNEKGLAYCIIKADGNKLNSKDQKQNSLQYKPCGFIQWDLKDKTTTQRQWVISNKITELLTIAEDYNIQNINHVDY